MSRGIYLIGNLRLKSKEIKAGVGDLGSGARQKKTGARRLNAGAFSS